MLIFTDRTALEYWRWHVSTQKCLTASCYHRFRPIPKKAPASKEALLESSFFRETLPVHVLVPDKRCSRNATNLACSVRTNAFPIRSFYKINSDVYVISPELLFIESAARMDFVELVRLGCELTASFFMDPFCDDGVMERPPLIRSSELARYIDEMKGYRGAKKAARAADFVLERSASPMEVRLGMLLTVPRRLGGFGLPKPIMNQRQSIGYYANGAYHDHVVFDLFWKKARLDVEYDSDQFHAGRAKLTSDSIRRNAIRSHGFKVISVTSSEFASVQRMTNSAKSIASIIDYRLPRIDIEQEARIGALIKRLLSESQPFLNAHKI